MLILKGAVYLIDGGALRVNVFGNDVQHPEDYTAHTSAKGVKCDSAVLVKGGLIEIAVFGKGGRCEGFESKRDMIIDGENTILYVYADDDAINASGDIIINNGRIYAYSVANDAIDGNARIELNGGVVLANGGESPEQGVFLLLLMVSMLRVALMPMKIMRVIQYLIRPVEAG